MGNVFYFDWEIKVMEWIQSFESPFLTQIAKYFTMLGEEYLMIIILGLCYWCYKKDLGRKVSLAVCGTMMSGTLIKAAVLRRRPYMDNKSVKCIRAAHPEEDLMNPNVQGYSCPSLHASMSMSVYGTIFRNILKKIIRIICILLPLFIGLSRVYLGVHYPSDVILGWIIGLLAIFLFGYMEKKIGYKKSFIFILIFSLVGFVYCRDTEFYSCYGITLGLLLGFMYEEKNVKFKNSNKWWSYIVRLVLGLVVFIIVNTLLKLPVKNMLSDSYLLLIYRTIRYTIATFVIIGLYPHLFKKLKI